MVKSPRIKASPFGAMLGGVAAPSERFNYTAAVGCRPSAVVLFSAENPSSVIGNTYTPRRGFIAVKRRSHEVLRLVFNYWSGLCRSCQGYEKFFATGSHPPAWHRRKNFFSALRATLTRLAPLTWSCILAVAFLYARGASTPRAPPPLSACNPHRHAHGCAMIVARTLSSLQRSGGNPADGRQTHRRGQLNRGTLAALALAGGYAATALGVITFWLSSPCRTSGSRNDRQARRSCRHTCQ